VKEAYATSVTSVPSAAAASDAGKAPGVNGLESLRKQAAGYLRVRGVGPRELVLFALAFSATAAFVFLLGHPGLGGVLGLMALVLGELSMVPPFADKPEPLALAASLNPLVDLLTAAGVAGYVAGWLSPFLLVLSLAVCVLLAWLPLLKASAGTDRMARSAGLWRRGDRMAILLFGVLLGRLGPALLVILAIGILDAWLRVERIGHPAGVHADIGPRFAQHVLNRDGSFVPAMRWGTLALTFVALWLLPQSTTWRF
jgi:hypothetical protein